MYKRYLLLLVFIFFLVSFKGSIAAVNGDSSRGIIKIPENNDLQQLQSDPIDWEPSRYRLISGDNIPSPLFPAGEELQGRFDFTVIDKFVEESFKNHAIDCIIIVKTYPDGKRVQWDMGFSSVPEYNQQHQLISESVNLRQLYTDTNGVQHNYSHNDKIIYHRNADGKIIQVEKQRCLDNNGAPKWRELISYDILGSHIHTMYVDYVIDGRHNITEYAFYRNIQGFPIKRIYTERFGINLLYDEDSRLDRGALNLAEIDSIVYKDDGNDITKVEFNRWPYSGENDYSFKGQTVDGNGNIASEHWFHKGFHWDPFWMTSVDIDVEQYSQYGWQEGKINSVESTFNVHRHSWLGESYENFQDNTAYYYDWDVIFLKNIERVNLDTQQKLYSIRIIYYSSEYSPSGGRILNHKYPSEER